jgi:hypothetical protein
MSTFSGAFTNESLVATLSATFTKFEGKKASSASNVSADMNTWLNVQSYRATLDDLIATLE